MDNKAVGRFIAERRRRLNMTQRELAEKLNITDRAVSRWERGVGAPDISLILPLAEILNVSADELLEGNKKEEQKAPFFNLSY